MLATVLHLALAMSPEIQAPPSVPEAPAPIEATPAVVVLPVGEPAPSSVPEAPPLQTATIAVVPPASEPAPAPVVTMPTAAPAPVVAPTPLTTPELAAEVIEPAPAPAPSVPLPRFRGIGLFVSGGLFGAVWLPLKIIATSSDLRLAKEIDRGEYDPSVCVESCYVGFAFNAISAPLLVTSAGLLGGGMNIYGRWLAHRDVQRGLPHDLRRTRRMTGLGFGLIGGGLAAFVASRFAMRGPSSDSGYVALRELGWWAAAGGLYAGAGLAGYGRGYGVGRRKAESHVQAHVLPMVSSRFMGVGVSGRF
jgi:hypothetical protein